jgi:Zn-dependent M28 family amino/carboxypeptidase
MKRKFHIKIITRGSVIRLAIIFSVISLWGYFTMIKMPGKSYVGSLTPLTEEQLSLRVELLNDIEQLAGQIGQRNIWNYHNLAVSADYIEKSLNQVGYDVRKQNYDVEGKVCSNIEAQLKGIKYPEQIIIIGAHYDSYYGSPGANDNASAVAATLALARYFAAKKTSRTLRFVLFANEEPPFYHTEQMGSLVYAKSCFAQKDVITAMFSLETIGYYSEKPRSQNYPFPFNLIYPSTGDFVGFISNTSCRKLLYTAIASFRKNCEFPSQGGAIPEIVPGINWSDHWSFWKQGYPAIMVTDTAPFRYPFYHSAQDTPDKINYDSLARVVFGLQAVIGDIAGYVGQ